MELLPVLAYDTEEFSLAGSLEPACEIGGDAFDYAADADALTVSVTDAMGHGLQTTLASALATAARRRDNSLIGQVGAVNAALHSQFGGEVFATKLLPPFDLATGAATMVNAGHPMSTGCVDRSSTSSPRSRIYRSGCFSIRPSTSVSCNCGQKTGSSLSRMACWGQPTG
jgi:serine phosphatase RsbU (regulator of sigma subunit)